MSGGEYNRAFIAKLSQQNAWEVQHNAKVEDLTASGTIFYFQYNPKEFKLDDGSSWEESKEQNQPKPLLTFKQGSAASISFDVLFDTTDTGQSVETEWVTHLRNMLSVETFNDGEKEKKDTDRPPYLIFGWKDYKFICVLEKLGVAYMMFKADGTPLRAKCSITLKEIRAANDLFKGRASGTISALESMVKSADTVKTRKNDSVAQISKRTGVSAEKIIKANPGVFGKGNEKHVFGGDDFTFEIGTELVIPRNDAMAAILAAAALAEVALAWASTPSISPFDPNMDELPQTVPSAFEEKNPLIFKGSGKYSSDNEYAKVEVAVHFDEIDRIKANTGDRNKFDEHKGSDKYKSDNEYGKVDVQGKVDEIERIKANTGDRNKFEKHDLSDKFKSDNEYKQFGHKDAKYDKVGGADVSAKGESKSSSNADAGKAATGERNKFDKVELKTGAQKGDNELGKFEHKDGKADKVGGAEASAKADSKHTSDHSAGKGQAGGDRPEAKAFEHGDAKHDKVGGAEASAKADSKHTSDSSAGAGQKGESKHSSDNSAGSGGGGGGGSKDGGGAESGKGGSGSDGGGKDGGGGGSKDGGAGAKSETVSAKEAVEKAERAAKSADSGGGSKSGGGKDGGGGSESNGGGSSPKGGGGSGGGGGGGGSAPASSGSGGGAKSDSSSGGGGASASSVPDGGGGGGKGGGGKGSGQGKAVSVDKERPADAGGAGGGGDATVDLLKAIDEMSE